MDKSLKPRILITGGCGKIGSYFAKFASDKYAVRVIDKVDWDTKRLGPLSGESLVCDLQNLEACRKACAGIDMVIHLAADPSPKADFIDSLLTNNIITTYNMFRAAQEVGCKRFIFASSVHVVAAYPADVEVKVNMPVRPKNLYGVSKCFGEALAAYFALNEGLPSIVLRIGAYVLPKEYINQSFNEMDAFISADDIANAISDNKIKRLELTETRELLGYQPKADSFDIFKVIKKQDKAFNKFLYLSGYRAIFQRLFTRKGTFR
jgi:nucleoside-diphosphate-sugar epimerase